MAAQHQPSDFRTIRIWAGSQHLAFEELCYQLLREPEDLPPGASLVVRTGNPDGGVEWYVNLADGTQWGWQAKYYFSENLDSFLNAMTDSVRRIIVERPTVRRLTFCIPFNLADSTEGGRRQSARRCYEAQVRRWQTNVPRAKDIEFLLVQESDLADRLSLAKHVGRRLFWFNQTVFTRERIHTSKPTNRLGTERGERYRPELQVDLPIEGDLQALGYSDKYFEDLERHRTALVRTLSRIRPPGQSYRPEVGQAFERAFQCCQRLRAHLREFDFLASSQDPLELATRLPGEAANALTAYADLTYDIEQELSRSPEDNRQAVEHIRSHGYHARNALATWLPTVLT